MGLGNAVVILLCNDGSIIGICWLYVKWYIEYQWM